MKNLLLIAFFFLAKSYCFSQNYRTAIGLRGSYFGWGAVNVKQYISPKNALEFSLGGSKSFLWGEALFEWNNQVKKLRPLEWYLGAGIASGYYDGEFHHTNKFLDGFHFGARLIGGIDITTDDAPFNFSIHTGPYFGFTDALIFDWHGSFAIRFAIK